MAAPTLQTETQTRTQTQNTEFSTLASPRSTLTERVAVEAARMDAEVFFFFTTREPRVE